MKLVVRVEDVMTPRNLLEHREHDAEARDAAEAFGFDAIPIVRRDGKVTEFWSRPAGQRVKIGRVHRSSHDASIESLLAPLGSHHVQFVHYRSEFVGLVDASDLNKPIARIAWLHPMLELERAILDAARRLQISEEEQAAALGNWAKGVKKRHALARRANLELPLLEYAQFPHLLQAASQLGILDLAEADRSALNTLRKRAAHSGDLVLENREDCTRIARVLNLARRTAERIRRRRSGQPGASAYKY